MVDSVSAQLPQTGESMPLRYGLQALKNSVKSSKDVVTLIAFSWDKVAGAVRVG